MRDPEGIARAIREARTIAICSHISPDGDTIGSALAMRLAALSLGKTVRVFCQDKVPDNLLFLPGVEEIRSPLGNQEKFDLFLAVDVSDRGRMGACAEVLKDCAHTAQIDHHETNPGYAEINSVDGAASATATMLRDQIRALGLPLTREMAICLYTGISTDTGNFSFDCTDAETFRVMSDLMEVGLPLAELNLKLFRERDPAQLRLLGRAIQGMWYEAEGRLAVMALTRKDFEACGALSEHSDTLVNYGLETTGTEMALLARETEEGRIKFSLRARPPLRVDLIAARLGGGGHALASGITMEGPIGAAVSRVIREMLQSLDGEKK